MSWEPLREFVPEVDKFPRPLEFFFGAQLVANLRRRGHEIHVFTLCRDAPEDIQMKGDGVLASQAVMSTTAVSAITIFTWVFALTSLNML
jgi:hypothetical protein